jgi:predicted ferric reductase
VLYEWFLNAHTVLSIAILIALWRHIPTPPTRAADIFLRIGTGLWAAVTAVHWCLFAFRNYASGRPFARVVARRLVDEDPSNHAMVDSSYVLRLDVSVPRPWRVRAGQSIFLSIPRLGVFTGVRGHPFMISWWHRDRKGLTLSLLVQSRAGFTAELNRYPERSLLAFIDGPYGAPHDLGEYGTVIMLASGIGIAGHMPYIKELISGYNSCEVRTRRVLVVWQVHEECELPRIPHPGPPPPWSDADSLKAMSSGSTAGCKR